jgi:alpha-L-fucosidase
MPLSLSGKCRLALTTGMGLASAIGAAVSEAADPMHADYATTQVIAADDSPAVIAEKAANVLPRPNQSAWMRLEQTYFIHFGPNTFRGVEWGNGHEDPAIFNPTALDADQWIRTIKDAGGTMVILVAKHHDGMSLWPTRYSGHSVAASPWRDGKGDLVREVADAARRHGVKLGIYLSPADLWQLRTNASNPDGLYGDGSAKLRSVIPTDPASFKSDPAKGRAPTPGFGSYVYEVNDYNRYFLNQLYELLTEYGPVDEVWFDGANPDPSVSETYDYAAWYDLIRKLQPQAVIFGKGPDARWVGNESGVGRTTEWSVVPLPKAPEQFNWPDMTDQDLGSRSRLVPGSHLWWYPAEVNTSILYGWFWAPRKPVKTASDLIGLYYQSVGRNGNMLLNLPPDTRGLIPDNQVANLRLMAQVIGETFARNLAAGATVTADSSTPANEPAKALDGDLDSWWEAAPGAKQATITLTLPSRATFDVVSLQEAVDKRGQRIESFEIDVRDGSGWKTVDAQTTVGHKRLLRLAAPVTTDQVRIRILSARLEPTLAEIGLFKQAEIVPAPSISARRADGTISLACRGKLRAVYTLDGSVPTPQSDRFATPIPLLRGGDVNAACVDTDGRIGMIASKRIAGFAPIGWQVVSPRSHAAAPAYVAAIDGDPSTLLDVQTATMPFSVTVDMKRIEKLGGFSYLPRQDKRPDGIVESYRFETSVDGKIWKTAVAEGRFDNIRNNPMLQEVRFAPVRARYFRFTALKELDGRTKVSMAELGVLPVEPDRAALR